MASDVPPPADHSALFSDPAEMARWHDRLAEYALMDCDEDALDYHERRAKQYRRMAACGEKVAKF